MRNFRKKYFRFCANCSKKQRKTHCVSCAKIAQKFAKKKFARKQRKFCAKDLAISWKPQDHLTLIQLQPLFFLKSQDICLRWSSIKILCSLFSNKNSVVSMKIWGLQKNQESPMEFQWSPIKILWCPRNSVLNENLWVFDENLMSPIKNMGFHFKSWGL